MASKKESSNSTGQKKAMRNLKRKIATPTAREQRAVKGGIIIQGSSPRNMN